MTGFTRTEVEGAIDLFLASHPKLAELAEVGDRDRLLAVLEQYYNGYRFSPSAVDRVFNSDMVLYFLSELHRADAYPADMLDVNVRTDYQRLLHIGVQSGAEAEQRRDLLETIAADGGIQSRIVRQFGVQGLASREQFLSFLYYLGMLTLGASPPSVSSAGPGYHLEIPNRVIRDLQWEHLAILLADQGKIRIDTRDLDEPLRAMATGGDIAPFLALFHTRVVKALGIKDLRRFDEKSLKLMLLAFISLTGLFYPLSEKEFAQGYCDLFLGVSPLYPAAKFAWLLELKYLPSGAKPALDRGRLRGGRRAGRAVCVRRETGPLAHPGPVPQGGITGVRRRAEGPLSPVAGAGPRARPARRKEGRHPPKRTSIEAPKDRASDRAALTGPDLSTPFTLGEKRGGALQRRQHHEVRRRVLRCVGGCVGEAVFADDAVRRAREALIPQRDLSAAARREEAHVPTETAARAVERADGRPDRDAPTGSQHPRALRPRGHGRRPARQGLDHRGRLSEPLSRRNDPREHRRRNQHLRLVRCHEVVAAPKEGRRRVVPVEPPGRVEVAREQQRYLAGPSQDRCPGPGRGEIRLADVLVTGVALRRRLDTPSQGHDQDCKSPRSHAARSSPSFTSACPIP